MIGVRPVGTTPQSSRARRRPSTTASRRRAGCDAVAGTRGARALVVELVVGQPVAAVDDDGGGQVAGLARPHVLHVHVAGRDPPRGHAELTSDTGSLQPRVGVGQVPGERELGAGDLVGRDDRHLSTRSGEPLGHADAHRSPDGIEYHDGTLG